MAGHVWRDAIDHLKDHTTRWGNDESRIFMPLIGDGMNQVIESDLAHALKSLHRCLSGVIRGKWASRTAIGFAKILSGAKTQGTSCFEVTPKGTSTKCYLPSPEWLIKNFAPQEAAVTT